MWNNLLPGILTHIELLWWLQRMTLYPVSVFERTHD